MTREERLLDILKQKEKTLPAAVHGVVEEVNESYCSVKLASDLVLKAVRYTSTEGAVGGVVITPKLGSNCLIGYIGGDENRSYLISADEVTKVDVKIGKLANVTIDKDGVDVKMDKGKLKIENNENSLKTLLEDILSIISKITVSTGTGPSGTPLPPTIAAINQQKNDIKTLFK